MPKACVSLIMWLLEPLSQKKPTKILVFGLDRARYDKDNFKQFTDVTLKPG